MGKNNFFCNDMDTTILILQIDNVVRLDNWINLEIDPNLAAKIVALRPALESLIVKSSKDPEQVLELEPSDVEVRIYNLFRGVIHLFKIFLGD